MYGTMSRSGHYRQAKLRSQWQSNILNAIKAEHQAPTEGKGIRFSEEYLRQSNNPNFEIWINQLAINGPAADKVEEWIRKGLFEEHTEAAMKHLEWHRKRLRLPPNSGEPYDTPPSFKEKVKEPQEKPKAKSPAVESKPPPAEKSVKFPTTPAKENPKPIYSGKVHLLSPHTLALFSTGAEQSVIISAAVAELGINKDVKGRELYKQLMMCCHPSRNPPGMNGVAVMTSQCLANMDFSE